MKLYFPEISFSAAHYIPGHKKCGGIHGHTYYIRDLTIDLGEPKLDQSGMSIDFGIIKGYFKDHWDHKFIVPTNHYMFLQKALIDCEFPEELNPPMISNMVPLEFTTCEGMAEVIREQLVILLRQSYGDWINPSCISFKLFEGPNQAVEV